MSRGGKPAFFESWVNDRAAEPQHEDFPYHVIDGQQQDEIDLATVAAAVTDAIADCVGNLSDCPWHVYSRWASALGKVLDADPEFARRYGLDGEAETAIFFGLAGAVMVVPAIAYECNGRCFADQLRGYLAALAWVSRPAVFAGEGLPAIARKIGCHPVTMSKYTADLSRCYGVRSHSQSKGWNWKPNRPSATREALQSILGN